MDSNKHWLQTALSFEKAQIFPTAEQQDIARTSRS
jgi:hypothetical protein